jgi:phosphate uptake regulator
MDKGQQDHHIENNKELQSINTIRSKIQQRLKEKGAIASNLTTDFDRIIKKLDTDLLDFENELKVGGNILSC